MLLTGEPRSGLRLRRVRLRGQGDELRARMRLERGLAGLDPATVGLPPRALLIIRRVEVRTPLRVEHDAGPRFTDAAAAELRRAAGAARRVWLSPDAANADAVWFADDAELAACLLRDWFGGRLIGRWWWPSVLANASLTEWLRAAVLPRGEVVVSSVALLASVALARRLVERLDDRDVAASLAALEQRFGVSAVPPQPASTTVPASPSAAVPSGSPHRGSRSDDVRVASASAAARMLVMVPELRGARLAPARQRLLAIALVAARAPGLLRERSFEPALAHLAADDTATGTDDDVAHLVRIASPMEGPNRLRDAHAAATDTRLRPGRAPSGASGKRDTIVLGAGAAGPRPDRAVTLSSTSESMIAFPAPVDTEIVATNPSPTEAAPSRPVFATSAIMGDTARPAVEVPPSAGPSEIHSLRHPLADCEVVHTALGGLFYLLDAALALGIYGDFTMPRAPGIALSPWDFLALVGRRWFGDDAVRDQVWPLLASLAGRAPDDEPGRDFVPPGDWSVPPEWLRPFSAAPSRPRITSTRVRLDHPAGFAVLDVARLTERAPRRPRVAALRRWTRHLAAYLRARLAVALQVDARRVPDLLCRHEARVSVSASDVDVYLALADLPLAVRLAGLDRDCGWIPAAGRRVTFHFV